MTSDLLLVERTGPAVLVRLNRPGKRNALSIELRILLAETLEALGQDQDVTAVGLTGAGTAFCAGMDVTQFGGDADHKRRLVDSSIRCFRAVAECPKPTVALVNGPALAGGFALALLCDLRVAAPEATFGFPELGRGIPPAYAAAVSALAPAVARDLCLTGRLIDAQEALVLGVVSRISRDHDALHEIAGAPGAATAEVKWRILRHRAGASPRDLLVDEEAALRGALLGPGGTRSPGSQPRGR
jgi:enoyl-CoA hydratase/carnithine racemase